MAKLHSALTNAELHNPKGITSESTGSILALNQSTSYITASAHLVPSADNTYNLGTSSLRWKDINFTGNLGNISGSTISGSALHIEGNGKITGDLTLGGDIQIGDSTGDSITITADFTSNLIPNADNTYDLGTSAKNWRYGYIEQFVGETVTTSGNVSGSSTSTGSFGTLETSGEINASGRIYEAGSSVIDHATAMAIVFGG